MSGRTFIPLPEAGPLKLPAAIVHPDDPLPKTWRLFSTWSYRGQRGAWLVREEAGLPMWPDRPKRFERRPPGRSNYYCRQPDAVQIVYRRTAPRRRTAHIGNALGKADIEGTYICDLEKVRELARLKLVASIQTAQVQSAPKVIPLPDLTPLSSPPSPGLGRAHWLGDRITAAASHYRGDPHTKRRAAARDVLATVDGYTATDAANDALTFVSASLHLAGLNEYARRVLDHGEEPHGDDGEAGNAVL